MRKLKTIPLMMLLVICHVTGYGQIRKSTVDKSLEIAGNYQFALVKYINDNGQNGENLTANSVNVRDLNVLEKTFKSGEEDWIELDKALNRIKLKAGIYHVTAQAAGYAMSYSKLILYDVTNDKELINGLNHYDAGYMTVMSLNGIFELTNDGDLELHQYTSATRTDGGGLDVGLNVTNYNGEEVYTQIQIVRLTKP